MGRALEEACSALNVLAADEDSRRAIVTRITDLARLGITDSGALAEHVIAEGKLSE